jgi:hypothetical protein
MGGLIGARPPSPWPSAGPPFSGGAWAPSSPPRFLYTPFSVLSFFFPEKGRGEGGGRALPLFFGAFTASGPPGPPRLFPPDLVQFTNKRPMLGIGNRAGIALRICGPGFSGLGTRSRPRRFPFPG